MNNPRFPLDSVFGIAFRRARQALSIEGQTDLLISRNMIRSNRGSLGTTWGSNISTIQLSFDFVLNWWINDLQANLLPSSDAIQHAAPARITQIAFLRSLELFGAFHLIASLTRETVSLLIIAFNWFRRGQCSGMNLGFVQFFLRNTRKLFFNHPALDHKLFKRKSLSLLQFQPSDVFSVEN